MKPRVKVFIVDDSAVVRQALTQLVGSDAGIEVLGAAADPLLAMQRMKTDWPDVLLLDMEMPRMDGLTFLRNLMADRPTPVVVLSTLTAEGSQTYLAALAAGAATVMCKPTLGVKDFLAQARRDIIEAVKAAAKVNVRALAQRLPVAANAKVPERHNADVMLAPAEYRALKQTTERVVAIGTSTGGTLALEAVLTELPRVSPGIVVVQHMPENFTAAFAERLDSLCAVRVREARHQDRVMPGTVLIAPGGKHMMLRRSGAQYHVEVVDGPMVNRHRPSVDVLFRSAAQSAGPNALGIIMTGMGNDGAAGLLEMHQAGARTLGQDERSCVVYGMPKEAMLRGGVDREVSLDAIAGEISRFQ